MNGFREEIKNGERGDRAGNNGGHDLRRVVFKVMSLFVERNWKWDGWGLKKKLNDVWGVIIMWVGKRGDF